MWQAIEFYFRSISDRECPAFLRKIFNDELTPKAEEWKAMSQFIKFTVGHFNHFNMLSQAYFTYSLRIKKYF